MRHTALEIARRIFWIPYEPNAAARDYLARAETRQNDVAQVTAAVLDAREGDRVFGVPLARRGIQPVHLKIVNRGDSPLRLYLIGIDPNYFTPLEAAAFNHFSISKRLAGFGLLALLFLPILILLLPFKLVAAAIANRRMDRHFQALAFHLRPVMPGETAEGFVFTRYDAGTKIVHVVLHAVSASLQDVLAGNGKGANASALATNPIASPHPSPLPVGEGAANRLAVAEGDFSVSSSAAPLSLDRVAPAVDFTFSIAVPGIKADHLRRDFAKICPADETIECDVAQLSDRLCKMSATTTNRHGTRHGDPLNLVVIGEFETLLAVFAARWDESETITLATCWKTARAFLLGSQYRYSPVSPLYLFGRSQDVALQRVRHSINERLHLRLWLSPLRFRGLPVWVGQISRDIGVRFTPKTWNLTTHRIDPDVDESRDYVVEDLLQAQRAAAVAYLDGVGECLSNSPRRNLTGDPYFTDGKRAAIVLSASRAAPQFLAWT